VRVISVASAPLTPERARLLAERTPNARVSRSYGLTESGAATAVWLRKNPGKMHTVGRPIAFRRVTVRDPEGRMLLPDQIGEVVIELPMWHPCDGYLDAPPELARRFENGVLWTGDRGAIDRHGFLVLGERQAELLKVGGRSVSAPRIEQALHDLPNTRELVVVGVPDRWLGEAPCAVFVPEPGCDVTELAATAGRLAAEASRADDVPKWWLSRVELPRGPTNKIRRGELAREAAAWTSSFPQIIAPEHRRFPAYDLEGGVTIVDGAPWCRDNAIDARSRVITLAMRDPARPLALGAIRAERGARMIVGPVAVERPGEHVSDRLLGVFAGELVHLARRLPGLPPQAICVFGRATGTELVPIDGHPGWRWKREGPGDPLDGANLDELTGYLEILVLWAQRASAASV
ncbi:MAG TPA: fatty acid--CoA ligase family protein, partial [Kofleriaceae bacterium]|nr:fatty acid--CoA ligase family protein [Kofleriaceae bacterium]